MNSNNILISVVMPVYNAEKYLDEAIQSILTQTYNNFEFIIINDGSTDKSLEIIEKYKNQDERIILISRENKGLIYSLNEGIKKSKGKYIARMDADDISLPERFQKQISLLEKENGDICGCHWIVVNESGKIIECSSVPLTHSSFILYLSYSVPFAHGSVMIRKTFFQDLGILYGCGEAKYAEDYELWLKLYDLGAKFVNVNEFLFYYRQFNQSLSQINFKRNRKDAKKLSLKFIKENKAMCIEAFNKALEIDLSRKEQELIVILGLRLSIYIKSFYFLYKSILKVDKKNLPSNILKSLYVVLVD